MGILDPTGKKMLMGRQVRITRFKSLYLHSVPRCSNVADNGLFVCFDSTESVAEGHGELFCLTRWAKEISELISVFLRLRYRSTPVWPGSSSQEVSRRTGVASSGPLC
jgi:hypothetical protein